MAEEADTVDDLAKVRAEQYEQTLFYQRTLPRSAVLGDAAQIKFWKENLEYWDNVLRCENTLTRRDLDMLFPDITALRYHLGLI